MNASIVPDPGNEAYEPREQIGAINVDAEAFAAPGLRMRQRIVACLSYFGVFPILVGATRPSTRFVSRHLHVAMVIFAVRVLWVGGVLTVWWIRAEPAPGDSRIQGYLLDALATLVVGFPLSDTWRTDALPWLLAPAAITFLATTTGAMLALAGRTVDVQALISADWTDPIAKRSYLGMSPEDEKALARRARERQIERLQKSSRMLRTEQARRTRMSDVEAQLERVELQRDYHDQLLALGEISQRRYEQVNEELDEQVATLRSQLSSLETRVQNADSSSPDQRRLRRPSETLLESLAIVTPDGVPIFTYGQFQLDDAIVAGMLSAFDSLSEEVFGSRVSKTALAEGQVLFFAHGDYVLAMASFIDEPSPRQVEDLRKMLKQFESANEGPIARKQYDPRYLHEVPVPFRFAERMPRASSAAQPVD